MNTLRTQLISLFLDAYLPKSSGLTKRILMINENHDATWLLLQR